MKHYCGGSASAQPLGAAAKTIQSVPSGFEQQAIHEARVVHAEAIEFMRQGEHHMEIRNRKELFLLLDSPHLLERLARLFYALEQRIRRNADSGFAVLA